LVKLPKDLATIDIDVVERLEQHAGVAQASGVLELWAFHYAEPEAGGLNLPFTGDKRADDAEVGSAAGGGQGMPMVMGEGGQLKSLQPTVVAGIDPARRTIGPVRLGNPDDRTDEDQRCCAVKEGRYLDVSDHHHAMLTLQYAEAKGVGVGDMVPLGPYHEFEVVGLVDISGTARIAGAEAFIPLVSAQEMFGEGEVVDTIFVSLESKRASRTVEDYTRELIGEGASITTESNVFAMLALVRNAMDNVAQRTHEIGVMKAIGWTNGEVGRLFAVEAACAALIGGLLGSVLGSASGWLWGELADLSLPSSLNYFPPCSTTQAPLALPLSTSPSATIFILGVAAALLIGTVAGLAAARRAARLDPTEALRQI
jgi:hypothetical protein